MQGFKYMHEPLVLKFTTTHFIICHHTDELLLNIGSRNSRDIILLKKLNAMFFERLLQICFPFSCKWKKELCEMECLCEPILNFPLLGLGLSWAALN